MRRIIHKSTYCSIGVFPRWNGNSVNSGNLIYPSLNWSEFKIPVFFYLCPPG